MLNQNEISCYFEALPRDLTIIHNGNTYYVNKESISLLSGKIQNLISENPNSDQIEVDITDEKNVMPLVADFLNAKKIEITPQNAFYLQKIANSLEIPFLNNALKEEISRETCKENVIQKILHCNENTDFLFSHIEDVLNNDDIFDLNKDILVELIHSEKAQFTNLHSRYFFAFRCSQKSPQFLNEFINDDDIEKIPPEVFSRVFADKSFSNLESFLPNSKIGQKFIEEIAKCRTNIDSTSHYIEKLQNGSKDMETEKQAKIAEIEKLNEKIKTLKDEFLVMKLKLDNLNIDSLTIDTENVSNKSADENKLNEIGTVLNSIDKMNKDCDYYIRKMQGAKIIYHESRVRAMKIQNEWNSILQPLHESCAKLQINDSDVKDFKNRVKDLSIRLRQLMIDYFEDINL
ncbi:hypothetical protein TRFO_19547 [Tritrichomonas foetus]|uniref:BTB domain-containing protein n=1 Tax=Tritrichomonas foetus TaxID=1144522 RepID=A0A1J4KJ53_9EUKA|nr:hypothetical protein TRFO_19547 [Tritrichomonas foetus]|eukprot:OHT10968.1 hypothetical protein TRFO_19547 [Tritrichomonas foetus]